MVRKGKGGAKNTNWEDEEYGTKTSKGCATLTICELTFVNLSLGECVMSFASFNEVVDPSSFNCEHDCNELQIVSIGHIYSSFQFLTT